MILPRPPEEYDANDQSQTRAMLIAEDHRNQKKGAPVLLQAPDGSFHRLVVANDGTLSTAPA